MADIVIHFFLQICTNLTYVLEDVYSSSFCFNRYVPIDIWFDSCVPIWYSSDMYVAIWFSLSQICTNMKFALTAVNQTRICSDSCIPIWHLLIAVLVIIFLLLLSTCFPMWLLRSSLLTFLLFHFSPVIPPPFFFSALLIPKKRTVLWDNFRVSKNFHFFCSLKLAFLFSYLALSYQV